MPPSPDSSGATPAEHLYVHVPFCDGKCPYCAFYSERHAPGRPGPYLAALEAELAMARRRRGPLRPSTLYIGGGTPTVLRETELARLLKILAAGLDLEPLEEWTVEANPGTLTRAKARRLAAAGVTRISIGAQALEDAALAALGRRHTAAEAAAAVRHCRSAGVGSVGLDLIAAVPGVQDADWERTLRRAIELEPDHISVYSLTAHPGTPLSRACRRGAVRLKPESEQLRALQAARARLKEAGYEQYEVSNYARPGHACRHNLSAWRGEDYLGLGPAAASRCGRVRRRNRASLHGYAGALLRGRSAPAACVRLSPADDATERFMFRFRLLREGVNLDAFCRTFPAAQPLRPQWETALAELQSHGLVTRRGPRWRLTLRGTWLADTVAAAVV